MTMMFKVVGGIAVAFVLASGIARAQAPGTAPGGAANGTSADCAELPVLTERFTRADKILRDMRRLMLLCPRPPSSSYASCLWATRLRMPGSARSTVDSSQESNTLAAG